MSAAYVARCEHGQDVAFHDVDDQPFAEQSAKEWHDRNLTVFVKYENVVVSVCQQCRATPGSLREGT